MKTPKITQQQYDKIVEWNHKRGIKITTIPAEENNEKYVKICIQTPVERKIGDYIYLFNERKLYEKIKELYLHFYFKNNRK